MNAYNDLISYLDPGEVAEYIVFGPWGWGDAPRAAGESWEPGYSEPGDGNPPVPFSMRGKVLDFETARPFMDGWSFYGGYGAPDCYAVRIWTTRRVIWVTQYDGSTSLDSAPRNPIDMIPDMPGS